MKKFSTLRPAFSKIYHPIGVHSFYNLCFIKQKTVWKLCYVKTAKILEKVVYVHDSSILHVYKVKEVRIKNNRKLLKRAELILI